MKKYIIYTGVLAIGLLLGWLLFGGASEGKTKHNHGEEVTKNQQWTCSMHPQIMQQEPGDCPICGMDLIPAEIGAEGLSKDQFKLTKNAMALANIQTLKVGSENTNTTSFRISGKIVANEETNAVQVSYFEGRVERLYINTTGERIEKGKLLATIYSPELIKAQQELLTAVNLKESQPALYKAVRNKLRLWKLSEAQINAIEKSKKVKENFPVYATVSGIVSMKLVEQGDFVKQGQALLKVTNLNSVWANFDVYESDIANFTVGQELVIATNAYPNEVFKTKVAFIDPVLNTKTRTLAVRAVLQNKKQKFKPGMFVSANVFNENSINERIIKIPASAVLWTGKRSVVYLKTDPDQPIFEMQEVVLGKRIEDSYEIKSGLKSGVELVVNGVFTVDASAQLAGKKSMMNHSNSNTEVFKTPKQFKEALHKVYNQYILLKDALIASATEEAKKMAVQMHMSLEKVDMKLLHEKKAHENWMGLLKTLQSKSKAISITDDIKKQREAFKPLSNHLIMAVEVFGINETTYKQFCPMADGDKGGYWLSKEAKVLNPYFGEMMLKCGSVKKTINTNN